MKLFRLAMLAACLISASAPAAFAQKPVIVGGAPMFANKNIVENAVNSKDHTTLIAAVKAAGLVETLADRKSTRLNSSHVSQSRMPSSA